MTTQPLKPCAEAKLLVSKDGQTLTVEVIFYNNLGSTWERLPKELLQLYIGKVLAAIMASSLNPSVMDEDERFPFACEFERIIESGPTATVDIVRFKFDNRLGPFRSSMWDAFLTCLVALDTNQSVSLWIGNVGIHKDPSLVSTSD